MNVKYSTAYVLHKYTNLLPWFSSNVKEPSLKSDGHHVWERMKEDYAKPRDIRLILLVRYEGNNECYCKIRCPINPLPVKGEFNAPSINCVINFLRKDGWETMQTLHASMFN